METEKDVAAIVATVGNEVVFRSRIRFRMDPRSKDLAKSLLADRRKLVLSEPPDGLEIWPLDEETAVMELAHRGPMEEYSQVRWAHRMNTEAQADLLPEVAGFAEIVPRAEFTATDPRI